MATQAQTQANQANAQHSTGPKSAAGKQRASRNSATHGLTTGYLVITDAEQDEYKQLAAALDDDLLPEGALEQATRDQIVDASWRLRKLHKIHAQMATEAQLDPLINPDCQAALKQLARYRAAMEMALYRALKTLGEMQTRRAARDRHLHEVEKTELPQHIEPSVYAKARWPKVDRQQYLRMLGRIGPDAIWELTVDEFYQPVWVRLPDPYQVQWSTNETD